MTVIGLVVEGTNDFPIVEAFVGSELSPKFSRPVVVRHLQPAPDATSGKYGGGGWGRVVGWCKSHSGHRLETYFSPIEEGDDPCDLILVQMDGDAMTQCAPHSSVTIPTEPCEPADRIATLRAMVDEWLEVRPERAGQIRFAFPVMQSEAWLLAALRPFEQNWEQVADAKAPFRALKPASPKMTLFAFYRAKAIEAAANGDTIAEQSESCSAFRTEAQR